MANGFVPYLLTSLKNLVQQQYAGFKIQPAGLTQALLENTPPSIRVSSVNGVEVGGTPGIKLNNIGGHIRTVQVKHLPRILSSQVQTADDCVNDIMFSYNESGINAPRYASLSFFVDWSRVEYYENESSRAVSLGNPGYAGISEIEEQLLHCANGLISAVDDQLLQDVNWGANTGNGNLNTAQIINIDNDATVFDLSNGMTKVLADARLNEVVGSPIIVGGGLMDNFMISKSAITAANAIQFNQLPSANFKYYFDIQSQTRWGANQFGVFAPGTIAFVDIDRYVAWKTRKFGNSWFATVEIPVVSPATGASTTMTFNMQVIEQDCPETSFPDGYSTITRDRGYQIILSKRYGLWQMPGNTVQQADRLMGVNGAFRYTLTNS